MFCITYYSFLLVSLVYAVSRQSHAAGCTAEDAEDLASFLQVDLQGQSDRAFDRELEAERRTFEREMADQHLGAQSDRTFKSGLTERKTYNRELAKQLARQQALEEAVESASAVPLESTSPLSELEHQPGHGHSTAGGQASEGRALLGNHVAQDTTRQLRAQGSRETESLLDLPAEATQSQGQGRSDEIALVSRLSDAVEAQSKAIVMLENDVEQIAAREVAFGRKEDAKLKSMATETCDNYQKEGFGPITDTISCKDACQSAEGLQDGSWKSSQLACQCTVKANTYRTICGTSGLSISLLATLGMLTILFRL
jgi:hypothetical protein